MTHSNIILTVLVLVVAWYILLTGLDKQAVHECLQWKEQSETLRDWYSTEAQRKQCETVGHPLPIKTY
jgi:hypothetical protein